MTTNPNTNTATRSSSDAPRSHAVRTHLLIVGAALFAAGGIALWLFPDLPLGWAIATVLAVAHLGLIMLMGRSLFRWLSGQTPNKESATAAVWRRLIQAHSRVE